MQFKLFHYLRLPLEMTGPDSFFLCVGSLHLLPKPVTFPALPVTIYTPSVEEVIMVSALLKDSTR